LYWTQPAAVRFAEGELAGCGVRPTVGRRWSTCCLEVREPYGDCEEEQELGRSGQVVC